MILKPNMVIDEKNVRSASVEEVAERSVQVLKQTVPAAVPGIAFLSGGKFFAASSFFVLLQFI
ncbi:fructose-bisphosphate aldolase class 1 [Bartonella japonica]|uniref:fructose-bisphosphate aldolase n=1 Tax=Bartonella japonica TaxID=357761 RepID=A0ABV2FLB8_9HYPH